MGFLTNPVINVDNNFQVMKSCSWLPGTPIMGDVTDMDYAGDLYVNALYRKEVFQLEFLNLDEQAYDLLKSIFNQIGTNVFHTVEVVSPKMRRIWDGFTANGPQINGDVARVRNQVYFNGWKENRISGNPNRYQVTITCQES